MTANRTLPQQEFEQTQGNRAAHQVVARSPHAVIRPPLQFVDAVLLAQRRKPRPVRKPVGAATFLRTLVTIAAATDAINVLPQNFGFRNSLIIRNSSGSAGNMLVGFGYAPTGDVDCDIELVPGAYVIQDTRVAQDDIWLFSPTGCYGSVTYSLYTA